MSCLKIAVAGEGGQGVQALAETLALAAYRAGLNALYIPNFGIEQRGGVSLAFVQISPDSIGAPKFRHAHLVAALSPRSLHRSEQYLGPETLLLYDNSLFDAPQIGDEVVGRQAYNTAAPEAFAERISYRGRRAAVEAPSRRLVAVPASDLARQRLHPRVFNMIILGAIVALTGVVRLEQVKNALEQKLNRRFEKDPQLRDHNHAALELGAAAVKETVPVRGGNLMSKTFARFEAANEKAYFYISPDLCKGCGLCIEKCPSQVIDWSSHIGIYGTPIVEAKRMERCTGCRLCQLFCPDAAIDILRKGKERPPSK